MASFKGRVPLSKAQRTAVVLRTSQCEHKAVAAERSKNYKGKSEYTVGTDWAHESQIKVCVILQFNSVSLKSI